MMWLHEIIVIVTSLRARRRVLHQVHSLFFKTRSYLFLVTLHGLNVDSGRVKWVPWLTQKGVRHEKRNRAVQRVYSTGKKDYEWMNERTSEGISERTNERTNQFFWQRSYIFLMIYYLYYLLRIYCLNVRHSVPAKKDFRC